MIEASNANYQLARLSVTASCPMAFTNFPMDTQTCLLEIESCKFNCLQHFIQLILNFDSSDGHNADGMILHWKDPLDSVQVSPEYTLSQFTLNLKKTSESIVNLASGKIFGAFFS